MGYQALLFCPDEKTARVVTQVLSELEFRVEPCNEPFAAVKKLMAQHFDAIVVDCDNEQNATLLFKSARNSGPNQNSLSVAVVEGQVGVAKAFRIGANLVLTKPINVEQSKGTLRVARGLLRKAEAVKPAGSAAPASGSLNQSAAFADPTVNSGRQFVPSAPAPSPAAIPAQHAAAPSPLASTSAFELDAEPAPPPDPAEAALLEYMPDSAGAPSNPSPQPAATSGTKEYPWQPVSKPLSEPMASSLRRAAESAGTVGKPAAAPRSSKVADDVKRSANPSSGLPSLGAAAAPARAKEAAHTAASLFESNLAEISAPAPQKLAEESEHFVAKASSATAEAPIFSSLDDPEESSEGQSVKKRVLFLAVAAAVIVTGYFGWTKLHPGSETPAVQQQQVAPASSPANSQAASSNQEEITLSTKSQSNSSEEGEATGSAPERVASSSSAKPSAGKFSAGIPTTTSGPAPTVVEPAQTPEPLVVTNQRPKQSPSASTPAEAVQAPALDAVASNNGDKAISGMLSAAPVNVPTQAPHTARISQGISQGLLVKRIAPMYPPTAKQMHVQGTVQLEANISKDGNITGVKQLSGDTTLGRAATEAVRQWKYKPYVLNGEPIEIQTQITVIFKLP